MNIDVAIDRLKNSTESTLTLLLDLENIYKQAKEKQKRVCQKCEEWEKIGLPYDCLDKPNYCVKNEKDLTLIIWYEELQKNYC